MIDEEPMRRETAQTVAKAVEEYFGGRHGLQRIIDDASSNGYTPVVRSWRLGQSHVAMQHLGLAAPVLVTYTEDGTPDLPPEGFISLHAVAKVLGIRAPNAKTR